MRGKPSIFSKKRFEWRMAWLSSIAAVEHALMDVRAGGYWKIRISPHLAYRDERIPDLISLDAVLIVGIWLRGLVQERKVHVP